MPASYLLLSLADVQTQHILLLARTVHQRLAKYLLGDNWN